MAKYAKAIVGALVAGLGALVTGLTVVWAVPNKPSA